MKKRKFALVLSGGGFKGAFQVGALNYLKDNWNHIAPEAGPMHFDIIAGVSVGALNGAMMAMGKQDELNELWDPDFWTGTFAQVDEWDKLIESFNEQTGVLGML